MVSKTRGMSDEAADPKISLIVPVYKVEEYLRACVDSVLAQTFTDFELILVDDGSPDKSGEICDELARQDSRIRVFHQENGGATSARRFGVEQARGEWINFVDADDLVTKDALKDLIDEASDDVDWVQAQRERFYDGETPRAKARTGKVKCFDLAGLVENMLLYHPTPWGKIVRKKLFSSNVFDISPEIKICEDTLMNLRLIANRPGKAKEIDRTVYYYRQQENSIFHTCVRTESYILRCTKLILTEIRKITEPSNKERLSSTLSRYLCVSMTWNLIGHGLPIKFPHRLAALMRRGARSKPRYFFIYLCLRFNCLGIARFAAKIFSFLRGEKLDPTSKTLLN